MKAVVEVGVAIVVHNNRVLVGVRNQTGPLPGLHEFPGGKCNPQELSYDCAVRECQEETGLVVKPTKCLNVTSHHYDHAYVKVHFWQCALQNPEQKPQSPFQWRTFDELPKLNWPAANTDIVRRLASLTIR